MAFKLTKPQKELAAIIETEGGTIVDVRKGGPHLKVDYTFDHKHFFTQHIPYSSTLDRRWFCNFRRDVRKSKRSITENSQ